MLYTTSVLLIRHGPGFVKVSSGTLSGETIPVILSTWGEAPVEPAVTGVSPMERARLN